MKRWVCLVMLSAAVLAAGCSKATMPETVTISRSSEGDVVPPSERTVTDQSLVEPLYASRLALPPLKPDLLRGCPPVPGSQVRLTFLHAGKSIVAAAADAFMIFNVADMELPKALFEAPPERKWIKIREGQSTDYDMLAKALVQASSSL